MEPLEKDVDQSRVNREMESWHQLPAEEDPSQLQGQTLFSSGADSQDRLSLCPDEQLSHIGGESSKPSIPYGFESLHLEFQDSRLSPVLTLLPQGKTFVFSESTLLHQTDSEFVPLRGIPDFSIVSESCPRLSHLGLDVQSTLQHTLEDQTLLSQHPLGATAAISEGDNSFCSLSQHSMSPESHYQKPKVCDDKQVSGLENKDGLRMEREEQKYSDMNKQVTDLSALYKDATAHVTSKSAMTSSSETALRQTELVLAQCDHFREQTTDSSSAENLQSKPSGNREQPQGGYSSSLSQRKTAGTARADVSLSSRESATSFITIRSTSMRPDRTTDSSKEQPQLNFRSDSTISGPENIKQSEKYTCNIAAISVTPASGGGVIGLKRALWSSASHTEVDGSFLTPQPVSQSTPAVLHGRAPQTVTKHSPIPSYLDNIATVATSAEKRTLKQSQIKSLNLSTPDPQVTAASKLAETCTKQIISSFQHDILQSQTDPSSVVESHVFPRKDVHPDPSVSDLPCPSDIQFKDHKAMLSIGRVHSLPSLSYLQKVDAWKANQTSSMSFYDNLALQGFDSTQPKRKLQESLSEPSHYTLTQPRPQHHSRPSAFSSKPCPKPPLPAADSSRPGSGSPRRSDVGAFGGAVASPLTQSQSHSSLSTVITSVQQEEVQHHPQLPVAPSDYVSLGPSSSQLPSEKSLVDQTETVVVPVKPNSDVTLNVGSALSSSQGSYHGEQSLRASMGAASSVISLEVDNYAPYWTSRPGSPPRIFELNIEDRIPMYLRNLGIDQSPSTILNPFTPRGPIREPEFSPTDLCTIKGSVGTPTKSTQPSEGDSPQKETFSSSSAFSVDSRASQHQEPESPTSPGSVRMVRCQVATPTEPPTLLPTLGAPQVILTPQREGSNGLLAQVNPGSAPTPGSWVNVEEGDSSLAGSATLHEIRRLLSQAESLISGNSPLTTPPGLRCHPESSTSLSSLKRSTQTYNDDSALLVGEKNYLALARSFSDSALKESSSSSNVPLKLSTQIDQVTPTPSTPAQSREEDMKSRDLRVAPRRAEPEGCSAADPDRVGPVSLPIKQGAASQVVNDDPQSPESSENAGVSSPEDSHTHSPAEMELGALSDSSSESSLAARVAKLLQSESPVSMVTSRPSTSDPEESRARDWILMKASGRQCEILDLNAEDRKRIEEIKHELLLNTKQAKSSDSEDSAKSSIGAPSQPAEGFASVCSSNVSFFKQSQGESVNLLDASVPTVRPLGSYLEAKVRQIALKEGIILHPPLTSISITTSRRTPSPQLLSYRPLKRDALIDTAIQQGPGHSTNMLMRPSADDKSQQNFTPNRATETERDRTVVEDKKGTDMNESQESKTTDLSGFQQLSRDTREGEIQLDSASAAPSKLQTSQIHLTLLPKSQLNATQRPPSPVRKLSKMQTGPLTQHSDISTDEKPLRDVPSSSGSEEEHASLPSATSSSKDRPTGQGCVSRVYSQINPRYPQTFSTAQRVPGIDKPLSVQTAAVPTLLPYKPHGSSELFYMPQTEPELSPVRSDTTVESSHPGSDDAVPPCFDTEVLGSRELKDKNVTLKHKEGIYSKRAKMNSGSTLSGRGLYDLKAAAFNQNDGIGSVYQLTSPSPSRGLDNDPDRNQRPLHFAERYVEDVEEEEEFAPLHMEADYSTDDLHHNSRNVPEGSLAPEACSLPSKPLRKEKQSQMTQEDSSVDISRSLDQLWHRFNEKWGLQETQSPSEGERSLLDRLERLSRLLHSSQTGKLSQSLEERAMVRKEHEVKKTQGKSTRKGERKERITASVIPPTAWQEDTRISRTVEEEGQENMHRCPAERDESASVSAETNSIQSTIDTQRLFKAFGPPRLSSGVTKDQTMKPKGSLFKLYTTINRQKSENGIDISEHLLVDAEKVSTDDSVTSADTSSSSIHRFPSHRGPAQILSSKRARVKLVSRGIQAGDLEIVVNGTRRHTRDVGTTFPSPCDSRDIAPHPEVYREQKSIVPEPMDSNSSSLHSQTVMRVTDEPKRDSRKENEPQDETGLAWFEPYSRTQPWREPLKERHLQVECEKTPAPIVSTEANSDIKPSTLVRLSLKEALELHRPEFVSRSRERMKRLCLLAEERKIQAVFNRERQEIFNRPFITQKPVAVPAPLPSKRVIPLKEMVQRSKRIYHQLPEVQRRREEAQRKAEYRSYRLNAQLFNKKVTNRVLGRRPPWH